MSRITGKFKELKKRGEAALITYIMAGDPDVAATEDLVLALERSGADMIELGVPFSDPLADGPTIQRAALRALGSRTSLRRVFPLVKALRKKTEIPIILMLYYNLVHKYGEEKFAADAAAAGVDGVIVPDLPPDEASVIRKAARERGLDMIFLLAPTSSEERIRLVEKSGVTGARAAMDGGIDASIKNIRRLTKKPVCVGFGVSKPEQARALSKTADGVIVGSAIVGIIEKAKARDGMLREVGRFVRSLKKAML